MTIRPTADPEREDLRAQLAVLEACVDTSCDAMFSQGADQRIRTWNRGAHRLFGYSDEEAIGQSASVLFPERLHPQLERLLASVLAGDRVEHFPTEVRRRDGMPVPIALSVVPVRDDAAEVAGFVFVARDITEERVAQSALAETETRLREAEALAHVGRWLWDVDMGAVQWSDELHRIHGIDPLAFDGTLDAHLRLIHTDDHDRVHQAMQDAVASARSFEVEYRIVRADGETRWIYSRAEPTVGSEGRVVGLRGIGHDVTDRRSSPD